MTPADRNVRRWLIASAGAVALAVVVGGITRLTESGLSITEWKPVAGILPPLTPAAWDAVYQQYLRIPEAQTVHQGITLAEFKSLYWWEWVHRLLARGVGLVLAIPYFWFAVKRRLRPGHVRRLLMLPILTAAQGALGWYMVKSGLIGRTDVSAYRLAAHLALALLIFVLAVWTALELGRPPGSARLSRPWARSAVLGVAGIVATMLSGAFVAGLDGGKVYNTFPLMGGRLIPPGYQALGGGDGGATPSRIRSPPSSITGSWRSVPRCCSWCWPAWSPGPASPPRSAGPEWSWHWRSSPKSPLASSPCSPQSRSGSACCISSPRWPC